MSKTGKDKIIFAKLFQNIYLFFKYHIRKQLEYWYKVQQFKMLEGKSIYHKQYQHG